MRRLLARCLEKDPRRRLRDIGEARIALEDAIARPEDVSAAPAPAAPAWRRATPWAIAAALAAALIAMPLLRPVPDDPLPTRLSVLLPAEQRLATDTSSLVAISPDGRRLVYSAFENGRQMLFRRDLDAAAPVALPGTEDGRYPVFSPDGRWVLFDDLTDWKKVSLEGGSPIALTRVEFADETTIRMPDLSPDGHGIAYTAAPCDARLRADAGYAPSLQRAVGGVRRHRVATRGRGCERQRACDAGARAAETICRSIG